MLDPLREFEYQFNKLHLYDRAYLESDKVKLFLKATNRFYREKLVVFFGDWESPIGLVTS